MKSYDAIIIGAGPAGSTAALLLARAGWAVAIVEKAEFPRRKVCGEFISAPTLSLLARSGVAEDVLAEAGPEVREVGVYAVERIAIGDMPRVDGPVSYGRALGRDRLDALLFDAARRAGATVYQPWRVENCESCSDRYACSISSSRGGATEELTAPVVIAAHGSWENGRLPLQNLGGRARDSDLLAFKASFRGAALPAGRMPVIAFPGGYGGLVQSNEGRLSFACCIRRDSLVQCRSGVAGMSAGAAVLTHLFRTCRGVREALDGATREERWLAVGPLRPGLRAMCSEGYFAVGNALGEAHPIVGEGISMAIQSAWLLCERLIAAPRGATSATWSTIGRDYEAAFRRNFAPRMRAASAFASLAMHRQAAAAATGMFAAAPALLALAARVAGKARPLRTAA
jgi:flavin-dependent dehydrogenase